MAERKPCVRCERPIDRYARACVYCNWDQGTVRPAENAPAVAYHPPRDDRARNVILGGIALVALVIIAFVVGALVHRTTPTDLKAAQTHATPIANSNPRATVTPVPGERG